MVKSCFWLCPLLLYSEESPQNTVRDSSISINSSICSREMMVRIIHAGGHEEVSRNKILVSNLMVKYPGMCLAKPEVFKFPHESLLSPGEVLLPGHKYFLVPFTTVEKLKRKYSERTDLSDSSVCSVKEIYVPKEKSCKISPKKQQKRKKQFVPPIRRQNNRRGMEWEPSLVSIEETSP